MADEPDAVFPVDPSDDKDDGGGNSEPSEFTKDHRPHKPHSRHEKVYYFRKWAVTCLKYNGRPQQFPSGEREVEVYVEPGSWVLRHRP